MGIVAKQSIKNLITTYLGFAIGAINTLFLYTHFLTEEYYGLVSYLLSTSNLIWPLIAFGVQNTLIKFFSTYTDSNEQNSFLNLMLILPFGIAMLFGFMGLIFYDQILLLYEHENEIVQPYTWSIYVLATAFAYFEVFFAWAKVKLKSVFGNALKEVFLRFCVTILLFLVYFKILSIEEFVYSLIAVYVFRTLVMMLYAFRLQQFKLQFELPKNYRDILKYSSLILIAGSVATVLIDLDKTMIERFLPIENVAKYQLCAFLAFVIAVPSRAMHQITYPLTAKLLNEQNTSGLKNLYRNSSLTLFVISGLLFVLILCNVNQLFIMIPEKYQLLIWVVLLISLGKLYDNLLGNNNSILYNSDYYRLILFIGVFIAVLAFTLNYFLIPQYGLNGAAMATFIAMFSYNSIKLWLVWRKFRMHPFSKNTLTAFLIIILFSIGFFFWEVPVGDIRIGGFPIHAVINIAIKSILIAVTYLFLIYKLKTSEVIYELIREKFKFLKK